MTLNMLSRRPFGMALAFVFAAQQAAAAPPPSARVGLPDLVVVGSEDHPYVGQIKSVSITVRNAGGQDILKSTTLRTRCVTEVGTQPRCGNATSGWDANALTAEHSYDVPVPPLHKGEAFVAQAHYYFGGGAGDYRVRFTAVIDPDNVVAESNETNNTSTFTRSSLPAMGLHPTGNLGNALAVSTPTPKPGTSVPAGMGQVPQLVPAPTAAMLTLSVDPPFAPGVFIWVVARNNSAVTLGAGTAKLHCEGQPCGDLFLPVMSIPALGPGQWATLGTFKIFLQPLKPSPSYAVTISTEGVPSKPLVFKGSFQ